MAQRGLITLGVAALAGGAAAAGEHPHCIADEVLQCINGMTTLWPACNASQIKENASSPTGYAFGNYCEHEWVEAFNLMLEDPAVGMCHNHDAIASILALTAFDSGYYTSVHRSSDGHAGLLMMDPQHFQTNAQDMDTIWPGNDYAAQVSSQGQNFFIDPTHAWRSVAAWMLSTNRIVDGCDDNLFVNRTFERQVQCMPSSTGDHAQALTIVESCLSAHAEPEPESEPEAEPESEAEGEPESESENETEAESEGEPESESEGEPESEAEGEPESESENESESESESEPESESEGEPESESEAELESEAEGEPESESENEPEADADNSTRGDDLVATAIDSDKGLVSKAPTFAVTPCFVALPVAAAVALLLGA